MFRENELCGFCNFWNVRYPLHPGNWKKICLVFLPVSIPGNWSRTGSHTGAYHPELLFEWDHGHYQTGLYTFLRFQIHARVNGSRDIVRLRDFEMRVKLVKVNDCCEPNLFVNPYVRANNNFHLWRGRRAKPIRF